MKKKFISWVILFTLLYSWVSAWDIQEVKTTSFVPVPILTDNEIWTSDILKEYKSILINNIIKEDYKYNQENFYSKKVKLNVSFPDNLKSKLTELYLIFWNEQNYGYPYPMYEKLDSENMVSEEWFSDKVEFSHVSRYDLDKNKIPESITINLSDIKSKIDSDNDYWQNFSLRLYWKLESWEEVELSNRWNIYIQLDTNDWKKNFLSNLMYNEYEYTYINIDSQLDKILWNLKSKYWTKDYLSVLEWINSKISTINKTYEIKENEILWKIQNEKDFLNNISNYYKIFTSQQILSQIKYRISREISENKWNELIDEIFWNY